MLDKIVMTINSNLSSENLHVAKHGGVVTNSICSQGFLFGKIGMSKFKRKDRAPLCACGCGKKVNWDRENKRWCKFLRGHYNRTEEFKSFLKGNQYKKGNKHTDEFCKARSVALMGNQYGKLLKGRTFTKEHLKNLSISTKGKPKSKKHRKRLSIANTGKKRSLESVRKQSLAMTGNKNPNYGKCGSLSPCWKGGVSTDPYCDIWLDQDYKQAIKDRDNNECQNPGCRKNCDHYPLGLHHIDHNKQECNPWDIITVCKSCNARANFNKEYWKKLYKGIMSKKYGYKYN